MKRLFSSVCAIILLVACVPLFSLNANAALTLYWPVPGHFSLKQNFGSNHRGIDIADSKINGAPIVAVCDGTIVRVESCPYTHDGKPADFPCCYGFGNGVVIKGADKRYYTYGHMKAGSTKGYKANVTKVKAGQIIGYVGNTGVSYGAHLHFAISKDTDYYNAYDPEGETYINTGVETPFSFSKHDSNMRISNTNATIAVRLKKPLENRLIKYGAAVYNENGVKLGSVSDTSTLTQDTTTVDLFWDVNKSMGITLQPGTKYYFDFWANVSGVTLSSSKYAFTTTGTPSYNVDCYDNYSGKNYFANSDFTKGLDTTRYHSRNTSVYTLSVDKTVKHNSQYNTLKIVGVSAGTASKDLMFTLTTSPSKDHQYYVGDSTEMTMSFWAKSSVSGAKMYIRWGYEAVADARTVTLTDSWQYYTVPMPRQALYGNNLHPYFDKAGTFWLSELQMEDGTKATVFTPETGTKTTITVTPGKTYSDLPAPTRAGYVFDGWYTNATAGTQVKSTDAVKKGNVTLYAHWSTGLKISEQPKNASAPNGQHVKTTLTATGDGLTYTWYFKDVGKTVYSKSSITTNIYSTEMNSWRSGRMVYCVVTDKYGNSVTSDVATLSMANSLKITKQPTNAAAANGAQVKTTLTATGDGLKYVWYFRNAGSSAWSKSSLTGNSYYVTMKSTTKGRQVYCVVTDKYGNSVKSNVVTLSMGNPLKITQQPTNAAAPNGTQVKTTLTATGDGLKYEWFFRNKGVTAWSRSSLTGNSYYVTAKSTTNGRQVYCKITDQYGNTVNSNAVTLYMGNPAKITKQPTSASAANGTQVKTALTATGDGLKYTWYFKNAGSSTWSKSSLTGNSYYATMSAKVKNRQVYCVVTDKYGTSVKSSVVTLKMK